MQELNLAQNNEKLRKLIAENPDLPICVLCHQDLCSDEYAFTYATDIAVEICEILDCETPTGGGVVYTDRDDLRDDLRDYYCDDYPDETDAEYDAIIEEKLTEYEPYWKKCISIRCYN